MNTQAQFDAAYNLAQDPRVLAASALPDPMERQTALVALAKLGLKISPMIFMNGWDPFVLMGACTMFGYSWIPGMLDPSWQDTPTGIVIPTTKPADAIDVVDPVNCDLATAFPPFPKPTVVTPPSTLTPPFVGTLWNPLYPGYYNATPNGEELQITMAEGQTIEENGVTYTPFKLVEGIGYSDLWKVVS